MSTKTQQEIAAPIELKNTNENESVKAVRNEKVKTAISTTKRITYIATLTAITLLFKIMGQYFTIAGSIRLSPTYFGWILSTIILGPFGGAVVGFTTDVLGAVIAPVGGAINPLITVANTLFPLFIGLCYKYLPFKNKNISLIIGTTISILICTMGLNSYAQYLFYIAKPGVELISFPVYLFTIRIFQPVIVYLNMVLAMLFLPVIKRLKLFDI